MRKLIVSLVLIITISITLSSCSPASRVYWTNRLKEEPESMSKIDIIYDETTGEYNKLYDGEVYKLDKIGLFTVTEKEMKANEEDVLLSWYVFPPKLGYLYEYYSYTTDNPVFFYVPRFSETYLRSDYNYETDTFVIEGRNQQFVFSDMFTPSNAFSYSIADSYSHEIYLTLYSETCPRLQAYMRIFLVNGTWFAGGVDSNKALFEVSDEFLKLLNIKVQVN